MIAAICLFLVGACAGAFMVIRHLRKLRMPGWVAIAHGLAGAAGFGLLLLFCVREPSVGAARVALGVLVGAIVLGCVNVVYHLRGIRHRLALILAHALVAVTGVGTLAYAAVTHATPSRTPPPVEVTPEPVAPLLAAPSPSVAPPDTAAVAAPRPPPLHTTGSAWTDHRVQFELGRASPTGASLATLASIAQDLKDDPAVRLVEVQGHADERGSDPTNVELTRARAGAVVAALVASGVAASRLRSAGYGARCPAREACRRADAPAACHDEVALRQDRRVTFVVLESAGERLAGPVACERGADLIPAEDRLYGGRK